MKASWCMWFGLLGLSAQVMTATSILDGNFESASHLFDTDYGWYDPSVHARLWYGEVAVTTNPLSVHDLFSSFGDHTTGSGNMLVVNGGPDPQAAFWEAELSNPLSPGSMYTFSFWAASVYPLNPATLRASVDGQQIGGDMTLSTTVGDWMQFSALFTAGSANPEIQLSDSSTVWSGNDFAVDDISLAPVISSVPQLPTVTSVPEPASWLLLACGLAVAVYRRRSPAR